jgi:TRAP-type C4-dicarboxylate transport system permease small subunit
MAERHRAHVTLDFLVTRFSPRVRRALTVINAVLTVSMVLVFFVWYGWSLTQVAMRQVSPFGGPPVGFGTLAIPVGGLLMVLNILRASLRRPAAEAGS